MTARRAFTAREDYADAIGLLTLNEVAERLRVSRRTVERIVREKRIRVVKIGSRTLVSERSLRLYIDELEDRL